LMAPDVAMAADTPQMETAEESIIAISWSIFNFLQSQKAKYQTDNTTTNAWISPKPPAFTILLKITVVPNSTKPIFTYNSVESASLNQAGSLKKLLMINPIPKLNITASKL